MARAKAATRRYRLFVDNILEPGAVIPLMPDDAHYLLRVLRLEVGAQIGLINGSYGEWNATLQPAPGKNALAQVVDRVRAPNPCLPCTLEFAPIRKERLELMVEKCTELGVTDFQPILTDYTQHRNYKEDRLIRIAKEAAEQCERLDLPTFHPPLALADWIAANRDPVLVALERTEQQSFLEAAGDTTAQVLIGPEGGFSPQETTLLHADQHCVCVTLGARLLRAETAAIACLSILNAKRLDSLGATA